MEAPLNKTEKKKIFLQVSSINLANDAMFTENDVNSMTEPWKISKKKLAEIGNDFVTADDRPLSDCAYVLFLDSSSVDGVMPDATYPKRKLYKEALEAGMKDKMALFQWEPESVRPLNYNPKVLDMFTHVLTWNDDYVDNKKFFKFNLPVPSTVPAIAPIPFNKKKLLVNITANKYSGKPSELYTERRKTISYFTDHYPNDFDLYGVRWNAAVTPWQRRFPFLVKKYKSYRGITQNKIETLSQYKFTLCYENMTHVRGFVTEKIFDSLKAQSVPIYWGADNIDEYVDKEAFIDRRQFKNDADLAEFLMRMPEQEYAKYIEAGEKYLKSDRYARFLPEYFCDTIIKVMSLK